ncbi:UDP-N-acetylglucosamine 2-epimerase (non-hydrolysing) [Thermoflexales bacterium]|nr:UDP-N-acetylglucosamine 2-epimerase (non-hydrolysing) [Thermoflexales bacterium]
MVQPPMKVMCIFGTRPEVIKMAPVILELKRRIDQFECITCATAQHRKMLDQALDVWNLQPDIDLNVMQDNQTPTQVMARVLTRLEPVLLEQRPEWILVQGDTTTVMASAIAAHHARIKIGHVEAGLRTADKWNPFPEEANRVITDAISDLCFAPTDRARQALKREGIPDDAIHVTGNTVIDALLEVAQRNWTPNNSSPVNRLPGSKKIILVTAHRRENFGEPLQRICEALTRIAHRSDVQVVYPVHPNPKVRDTVVSRLARHASITLLPPLNYLELVYLLQRCTLVLTDSGGLQEEAPSLGKPVLVMRETSERPEAIEAGTAALVGTGTDDIVSLVDELLDQPALYQRMACQNNPYGDGQAAVRIAEALLAYAERHEKLPMADLRT